MRAFIRLFQSRYRAASHFRRLPCASLQLRECVVSISLSSGFSFQGNLCRIYLLRPICFNLVIERLLISGPHARSGRTRTASVSISLSSGFSFQGPHTSAQDWLWRWFQSRYRAASHFRVKRMNDRMPDIAFQSRYRAASHFRRRRRAWRRAPLFRFNLVIERLLISGSAGKGRARARRLQFQSRYRAASHFRQRELEYAAARVNLVSISLSSGFSFQAAFVRSAKPCAFPFQSRYRAASHFRSNAEDSGRV